ncbi:hypothetical protein CDD83_1872 [Cordyceps sp. RAO-2017]|nr:hypothetical protein CDD83_1872 [Cordyceps sp. RAO-2017]
MFAKPRPKKSILPPPSKKRRTASSIEEIAFDDGARHEFLTGFQKRKQQRIKHAQEQATKQARQERLEARRQVRQERRREVEEHVETINRLLRKSGAIVDQAEAESHENDEDEWDGFPDKPHLDIIDHEEEYIDEDRYTTVTVESVLISRDGFGKPQVLDDEEEAKVDHPRNKDGETQYKEQKPKRPKKKKFRYESKFERQLTNRRHKDKCRISK